MSEFYRELLLETYDQYVPLLFQNTDEHKHSIISSVDDKESRFELTFTKTGSGYDTVIVPDAACPTDKRSFTDIRTAIKHIHQTSPFRVTDFT